MPVAFVDETLTSAERRGEPARARARAPARKSDVDALAAAIILQSYLDELRTGTDAP